MKRYRRSIVCALAVVFLVCIGSGSAVAGYDLGGRTITIDMHAGWVTPFDYSGATNFFDPDPRLEAHIRSVEEEFNIELVIRPGQHHGEGRRQQLLTEILAEEAASLWTLMTHSQVSIHGLAASGLIHPVSRYIDDEWIASLPAMHQNQALASPYQGESYAFVGELLPNTEQIMIMFNKDIFEAEGLPDPHELWRAGEWTWDAYKDIVYRAARDTNGDGQIDQFGAGDWQIPGVHGIVDWAISNTGALRRVVDGRDVAAFDEPAFVEAVELWKQMFEDGVASPHLWGWEGRVAMVSMGFHQLSHMRNTVTYDYGVVPLPMGPRATEHVAPRGIGHGAATVIPITEPDPGAMIAVMDSLAMLTSKYRDIEAYEERFVREMELLLWDRDSLEVMEWAIMNTDPWNFDDQHIYVMPEYHAAIFSAFDPENDVRQALSQAQPAVQAVLDELLNQ